MARVYIPGLMQDLTGGRAAVQAPGETLRQVIQALEQAYPGIRERLLAPDGTLLPHVMVAVDGEEAIDGLCSAIGPESEVHFLPAIAGG